MKKILSIALGLVLILSVAGCTGSNISEMPEDNAISEGKTEGETETGAQDMTEEGSEETSDETDNADSDSGSSEGETTETESYLNFALEDGNGNIVDLSQMEGKFVFLNFFTTWCGYCMQEMPEFQSFYEEYSDKVEVVILNVQTDQGEKSIEEVRAWYDEAGYTFPIVFDTDPVETAVFYGSMTGYPSTFVFDENGAYLGMIGGAMDRDAMEQIYTNYSVTNQ